jgi:hypothetical protein
MVNSGTVRAVQRMTAAFPDDRDYADLASLLGGSMARPSTAKGRGSGPHSTRSYAQPRNWRSLVDWDATVSFLTNREFARLYRLPSYECFRGVCERIAPHLVKRSKHASTLRGGRIEERVKLAVALRYLAGGSYLDIALCHGVAPNSVSKVVRQVVDALLLEYGCDESVGLSVDKFGDTKWLKQTEATFAAKNAGLVRGCVGAIDGMAVKIVKPSKSEVEAPRHYFNRKGLFAIVLQAACDGNRKFTGASSLGVGSTHDSTCFGWSNLSR